MKPYTDGAKVDVTADHPERKVVAQRIAGDGALRLDILLKLGYRYLTLERSTPTLSPGELQRLRLATQVRSNLFGVVYVLDSRRPACTPRTPKRCSVRSIS